MQMTLALARALFALLIAVSLTFAPYAAAQARNALSAGAGGHASHAADCHKAKTHHHQAPARHDCCDHGSKSKCPDGGCGCAAGCGQQALAAFSWPEPLGLTGAPAFETVEAGEPPGLPLHPQGPPPKA
jgi:hypothetical protein